MRSLWALYKLSIRQQMHGKRWLVMCLLFLLPAGLAMLVRSNANGARPLEIEFVFAFMFIPQGLLPLAALVYAPGMIQDEQEEQTITYLLIRPISKAALYIVKLLATLTVVIFLTCVFTGVMYTVIYYNFADPDVPHPAVRCLQAAAINSLGVTAYCCLFGLMSLLTRRTLIVGVIYAAFFEGLLANLPLSVRLITVIYYTRIIAYRTMSFVVLRSWGESNIAADAWQLDIARDPKLLEHPQVGTCILVLTLASLVLAVLGAVICAKREFHVKTPEK